MKFSHNDAPQPLDNFQQDDFIQHICQVISDCQPPKGIAINGYWGTGKTSALLQIYYHLTGEQPNKESPLKSFEPPRHLDRNIKAIWFEAWRYQYEEQPIVALLHEIREQLSIWEKVKRTTKASTEISLLGALSAFDASIKAASQRMFDPGLSKLPGVAEQVSQRHLDTQLSSQLTQKMLQEAINASISRNGKNQKLLIFIDDLDRCSPEAALRLLEGIKVYLNLNNCVVLFGMDQRQIERALQKALSFCRDYPDDNTELHAREYLEKICQDIFFLPIMGKEHKSAYLTALLEQLALGNHREKDIKAIQQLTQAYDCLPANPRKIKALGNRLAFTLRNTQGKGIPRIQNDRFYLLLLLISTLYTFHRSVFEQIEKKPAYIEKLKSWSENPDLNDEVYFPMRGIVPSVNADNDRPVNPSDSNVFRLHELISSLGDIEVDELKMQLKLL